MDSIKFLGAAGNVTGSSYLLTSNNQTLLIDLGLFQGEETADVNNTNPLSFDAQSLSGVLITHAHLDHCGKLPLLIKQGYTKNIYMTPATKEIVHISLLDSANVEKKEKYNKPILYNKDDVEKVYALIKEIPYDKQIEVSDFKITFHNAGHILGSASIKVEDKDGKSIIFSGDLGNTPEDLIAPTEYFNNSNFVVMESTYGDKIHPKEKPEEILRKEINAVEQTSSVLLIPAFSIERTQELLHIIKHLKLENKIKQETPVFLDSPMGIRVTETFMKFPNLFNKDLKLEKNPFEFPNLYISKKSDASHDIVNTPGAKIIIAGSGMISGGRIIKHIADYAFLPDTHILFVGYQAVGTIGREILNGAKSVYLQNQEVLINAKINIIESLSSHADWPKLINWLSFIKNVKKVFLTHGEDPQRINLSQKIKEELKIDEVILPKLNEEFLL